jgi:hypothetical protein
MDELCHVYIMECCSALKMMLREQRISVLIQHKLQKDTDSGRPSIKSLQVWKTLAIFSLGVPARQKNKNKKNKHGNLEH